MKLILFILPLLMLSLNILSQNNGVAEPSGYLKDIKTELVKKWPDNRTINIVFHGHSVPSGYFKTPVVNTLDAYPYLLLKKLKVKYPYAVINIINTSIGGENAAQGAKRFDSDVLIHKPDVLFIDYSLNDLGIGLGKAHKAWEEMIKKALKNNVKVILMTPSPDQRIHILEANNKLEQHRNQVEQLAIENGVGLVDSYHLFKARVKAGDNISEYMSQINHPNKKGHQLIANEILNYFK